MKEKGLSVQLIQLFNKLNLKDTTIIVTRNGYTSTMELPYVDLNNL